METIKSVKCNLRDIVKPELQSIVIPMIEDIVKRMSQVNQVAGLLLKTYLVHHFTVAATILVPTLGENPLNQNSVNEANVNLEQFLEALPALDDKCMLEVLRKSSNNKKEKMDYLHFNDFCEGPSLWKLWGSRGGHSFRDVMGRSPGLRATKPD